MTNDERKLAALEALVWATQADADADVLNVYTSGLSDYSADIVSEAAARLAQHATRFPTLASVRAECIAVVRESEATTTDEQRTAELRTPTISQPRAKLWVAHLDAVITARRAGRPGPPAPEALDSTDRRTSYRCSACLDTGWELWECAGAGRRSCGRPDQGRFIDGMFQTACRRPHTVAKRCLCRVYGRPQEAISAP